MKKRRFRFKSYFVCLLVLAMVFAGFPVGAFSASALSDFSGGGGTEENPYLIETKEQLNNVRNYLGAHFKLVSDIVFTASDFAQDGLFYNQGEGWEPVGVDQTTPFSGMFDGNGKTITGLYINKTASKAAYVGLFGYSTGVISGLTLTDGTVTVATNEAVSLYVGGIVGYTKGEISHCVNYADVSVGYGKQISTMYAVYVGGVTGYSASSVMISHSENYGNVSAKSCNKAYAGGVVGDGAQITHCGNAGTITASGRSQSSNEVIAGGIAGVVTGSASYCWNIGAVTSSYTAAGGIAGKAGNYTILQDSFNAGAIVAGNDTYNSAGGIVGTGGNRYVRVYNLGNPIIGGNTGGIVGNPETATTFTNCYYLDYQNMAGEEVASVVGCSDYTADQMRSVASYAGFDFDSDWELDEESLYPYPKLKNTQVAVEAQNTTDFAGGNGSVYAPYQIATTNQLNAIRKYPFGNFVLTNDIVFSESDFATGGTFYNEGKGWTPIPTLKGSLDGKNYAVIGLTITSGNDMEKVGFIAVNMGAIQNITFDVVTIDHTLANETALGAVVGENFGLLSHVFADVAITMTTASPKKNYSALCGGLVGYNEGGEIYYCETDGTMDAIALQDNFCDLALGGIVGETTGTVNDNTNDINLSVFSKQSTNSSDNVSCGGIIGYSYDAYKTRNHNSGEIRVFLSPETDAATCNVGGLVGEERGGITQSSGNSGDIRVVVNSSLIDISAYVGGVTGITDSDITNCHNTGNIYAEANLRSAMLGGVTGSTDALVENCYNAGNLTVEANDSWSAAGGIIGSAQNRGIIRYCYNVGTVEGAISGAIIGQNSGIKQQSLYYLNTSKKAVGNGSSSAVACTAKQLQSSSCLSGLNFSVVWEYGRWGDYPYPTQQCIPHKENSHACISMLEDWYFNSNYHWKSCSFCDTVTDEIGHVYGAKCDALCDVCDYQRDVEHSVGKEYTYDANEHWLDCSGCDNKVNLDKHNYPLAESTKCSVCMQERVLESIKLNILPKAEYDYTDTELEVVGSLLYLFYDNGTTEMVALEQATLSGFVPGQLGSQRITVTFMGKQTEYNIHVRRSQPYNISSSVFRVNGHQVFVPAGTTVSQLLAGVSNSDLLGLFEETSTGSLTVLQGNQYIGPSSVGRLYYLGYVGDPVYYVATYDFFINGDVNEDDSINAVDALLILQLVVGKVTANIGQKTAGDVDGNGKVDAADALLILKKVVGKIDRFPVEIT